MALVERTKYQNGWVEIHDDYYKDKTEEDVKEIISRIEEIGRRMMRDKARKGTRC